jgi:rod shape-determining protein MreC
MGQVIHTSPLTATVLLITDSGHSLPVRVLRNGLRTIAVGTGHIDRLELPYVLPNADIRVGDLLVTSGLGGHFPPDYPVARVVALDTSKTGLFGRVVAEPLARLGRAQEVMLVWSIDAYSALSQSGEQQPPGGADTD